MVPKVYGSEKRNNYLKIFGEIFSINYFPHVLFGMRGIPCSMTDQAACSHTKNVRATTRMFSNIVSS